MEKISKEKYTGPERRNVAATPEEQFSRDVNGLAQRVIKEGTPIGSLKLREEKGSAEEKVLIGAVKAKIDQLFTATAETAELSREDIIRAQYRKMQKEAWENLKVGDVMVLINDCNLRPYDVKDIQIESGKKTVLIEAENKSYTEEEGLLRIDENDLNEDVLKTLVWYRYPANKEERKSIKRSLKELGQGELPPRKFEIAKFQAGQKLIKRRNFSDEKWDPGTIKAQESRFKTVKEFDENGMPIKTYHYPKFDIAIDYKTISEYRAMTELEWEEYVADYKKKFFGK